MKKRCYVCNNSIEKFMSFGQMPIANGFLKKEDFNKEYFFEMEVGFSEESKMFQLLNQPEPKQMFNENYAFFSGTSEYMKDHFKKFSDQIFNDYLIDKKDPFVVEIGSNDGIMLKNFHEKNIRHLGVDPSANVAKIAREKGINMMVEFFDNDLSKKIIKKYGKADAFFAANVMCHIPYINKIVEGIKSLLKPDGIVMFEDPYLGDVIQNTTYDQIYDEHTFLFSVHSVKYLFDKFEMEVINVEPQITHGGSMRYVIAHKGKKPVSKKVEEQLKFENNMGLTKLSTFNKFKENCESSRNELINLLNKLKSEGKSIAGYAATSKSTTIINYCDITMDHLECIYDTTPIKQGKFSPGAHIPIRKHSDFKSNYPDYALLFGYNHQKEIMDKEKDFIEQGGKWITYVPKVKIL